MTAPTPAPAATPAPAPAVSGPRFDLPTLEGESRPFWDGLKAGVLNIGHCNACGKAHYYPRPFCPHCWSEDVTLKPASGKGVLYTWSVIHMNDQAPFKDWLPYVAAMVDLEEGVRVSTNIVGCDLAALAVGMPVNAEFTEVTPEISKAVFRPA